MGLSILGALVGTYIARSWWQALLLTFAGAAIGRACFDALLLDAGISKEISHYVEGQISAALVAVVAFPA